jgi:hypothetical protein
MGICGSAPVEPAVSDADTKTEISNPAASPAPAPVEPPKEESEEEVCDEEEFNAPPPFVPEPIPAFKPTPIPAGGPRGRGGRVKRQRAPTPVWFYFCCVSLLTNFQSIKVFSEQAALIDEENKRLRSQKTAPAFTEEGPEIVEE